MTATGTIDPTQPAQTLVVTGPSGYIGLRLLRLAQRRGLPIVALGRREPGGLLQGVDRYIRYRFGDTPQPGWFAGAGTLVHLAAITGGSPATMALEIGAARQLVAQAKQAGLRFIFLSSQSARQQAAAPYGQAKWEIESIVRESGGVVLRAGLVYGGREAGGVFRTLSRLVGRVPILPRFFPDPLVQPLHVDDLCEAILAIATGPPPAARILSLAEPGGVPFTAFLRSIARHRVNRRRLFLPVPRGAALGATRLLVRLRMLSAELEQRILGLLTLQPMDTAASLQALGLSLRPLEEGMPIRQTSRRRRLIAEGWALSSYVAGERTEPPIWRRYAHAVEHLEHGVPLALPRAAVCRPWLLRGLDPHGFFSRTLGNPANPLASQLARRLQYATVIAEATPAGAQRFLPLRPVPWIRGMLSLCGVLVGEALLPMLARTGLWLARLSGYQE